MNLTYFMEQCPDAIIDAWRNEWNGAMYAFLFPRLARAWDNLPDADKSFLLDALRARFGQTILVGTVGQNFYYAVQSRLQLISREVGQDLLSRGEIKNMVNRIVGRARTFIGDDQVKILELVYPPAGVSHPLHRSTAYINAYPNSPPPPLGPPPDESEEAQEESQDESQEEAQEEAQDESQEEAQEEAQDESQEEAQEEDQDESQIEPQDESQEEPDESQEEPQEPKCAPDGTDVEESESENEEDVIRALLADTDDESDSPPLPAPLPSVGEDVLISMRVVMFHRYMMFLGNTKRFRINPLPAIQVRLSPSELADFSIRFRELEGVTADGWWISSL